MNDEGVEASHDSPTTDVERRDSDVKSSHDERE